MQKFSTEECSTCEVTMCRFSWHGHPGRNTGGDARATERGGNGSVVALSRAGGEDDVQSVRPNQFRHLLARRLDHRLQPRAELVSARRIAPLRSEVRHHRIEHLRENGSRRVVVEVEHEVQSSHCSAKVQRSAGAALGDFLRVGVDQKQKLENSNEKPREAVRDSPMVYGTNWYFFQKSRFGINCFELIGGPGEVRTPDPMVANHVLSQLSYRPKRFSISDCRFSIVPKTRRLGPDDRLSP